MQLQVRIAGFFDEVRKGVGFADQQGAFFQNDVAVTVEEHIIVDFARGRPSGGVIFHDGGFPAGSDHDRYRVAAMAFPERDDGIDDCFRFCVNPYPCSGEQVDRGSDEHAAGEQDQQEVDAFEDGAVDHERKRGDGGNAGPGGERT